MKNLLVVTFLFITSAVQAADVAAPQRQPPRPAPTPVTPSDTELQAIDTKLAELNASAQGRECR